MLFTAFNEDWGIVPIEAMAFGKPVVSVNRGGPLETIEHGVQGYLEPPEPARFASRMVELALDEALARRMGSAGPARARKYSWDAFTSAIDRKLEQLVSGGRESPARSLAERIGDARWDGNHWSTSPTFATTWRAR
jgi:alpha-1,3/alpha-1,6-mannosyltransferase